MHTECNMVSETLKTNHLVIGEAEKSHRKQSHGVLHNGVNGKHENLDKGTDTIPSYDETSGEEDTLRMDMKNADGKLDRDTPSDVGVSVSSTHWCFNTFKKHDCLGQ